MVVGASVAGLLAARALADHFARVTVVERDPAPLGPGPRRGVPQGEHAHLLFDGGAAAMERLLPGLCDELAAAGGLAADHSRDARWFHYGAWRPRLDSGLTLRAQTRPLLEWHVRRRVAALPNVRFLDGCEVVGLLGEAGERTVRGVRVRPRGEAGAERELPAALVVEAGGRGSRLPRWLRDRGHPAPEETEVRVDIGYATRQFERPPGARPDWLGLVVFPRPPHTTRLGVLLAVEGGRWMVGLQGGFRDYPPRDDAGFLEFARSLDRPELYEAIRDAVPATPIATYRFPSHLRRRYERLARLPAGLLVIGDALCSFNPIYGQGMSVCALEAEALAAALRRRGAGDGLARAYFRRAARIVDAAWLMATGADFLDPRTEGRRPPGTRLLSWYNRRVLELSATDETVYLRFLAVVNFRAPPTALFRPDVLWRVLFRRGAGATAGG